MHARRLGLALAAAFVAGVGFAALQVLLWPQVQPSLRRAFCASLAWGSWAALWLGLVVFLLWELVGLLASRRRRPRWERLSVWVGLSVAAIAFLNGQATRQLLPASHRQALQVVGAFAFLWALAWLALPRRRLRRLVVVGLMCSWVVGVWWPWWGAREEGLRAGVSGALEVPARERRALVVVWEGADVPWILPLLDRGVMPFLASLWPRGSWGQLRTVCPFSRAGSLTTLATGCLPALHQTVGRRGYRLSFLSSEPVSLLLKGPWPSPHQLPWRLWERAALPRPKEPLLWDVLALWGVTAEVVGWPFPNHVPVSSQELLREEPAQLDPSWQVMLQDAFQPRPERAAATRRALALAAQVGLQAGLAWQRQKPQVLVVHWDLPARLRPLWAEDDPGGVLPLAAQLLDAQLAELWRVAGGEGTYLLLTSAYGMAPPNPWDWVQSSLGLAGRWRVSPRHCPDGFFFLFGPGVAARTRVRAGRVQDVVPTLLYLLELPVSRRLSGKLLLAAVDPDWASGVPLRLVPDYPLAFP